MILLDTDHVTVLFFPEDSRHAALTARIAATRRESLAIPIVALEEQFRGWSAYINRHADVEKQVPGYDRLAKLMDFMRHWEIARFDEAAAAAFKQLRRQKVRIGTNDLKIAAIALVQNALLISANLRDYRKVPGLRVENWLEPAR